MRHNCYKQNKHNFVVPIKFLIDILKRNPYFGRNRTFSQNFPELLREKSRFRSISWYFSPTYDIEPNFVEDHSNQVLFGVSLIIFWVISQFRNWKYIFWCGDPLLNARCYSLLFVWKCLFKLTWFTSLVLIIYHQFKQLNYYLLIIVFWLFSGKRLS